MNTIRQILHKLQADFIDSTAITKYFLENWYFLGIYYCIYSFVLLFKKIKNHNKYNAKYL